MMGSGKSTIGQELSNKINYKFIDCDEYLELKYNTTVEECFNISEEYFRNIESKCLYELSLKNGYIIATGGGMVLRDENIKYFKDDLIIFINRPIEKILQDIDVQNRPLIKENKEKAIEIYNERIEIYKKSCNIELLNNESVDNIVQKIFDIIR